MRISICSACLLGINCRYNGKIRADKRVIALSKKEILIPVCPEQLGGMPTPREDAERRGNRVITRSGIDVTKGFNLGAREVLKLARLLKIRRAILKQRSPSCGSGQIYDGTFSKRIIKGDGITAELLKKNGVVVISEEDL